MTQIDPVSIGKIRIGPGEPLALFAGPCVIESERVALKAAEDLCAVAERLKVPYIYKSSFEKDNRSTSGAYRGPGLKEGLAILAKVKKAFGVPVISDVHREEDVPRAAEVLDVIQIPAFLCQQTSLVLAAGRAGRPVNVKKGQFMSPEGMRSAVEKLRSTGNRQILLTERGSTFGYHRLVTDFTSIQVMHDLGCPVIYDAGHAVRFYGVPSDDPRGGERRFIPALARAGVAAGADALFLECHPNPAEARCDAVTQFPIGELETLVAQLLAISKAAGGARSAAAAEKPARKGRR